MNAKFNSLERNRRYTFAMGHETFISGVFHEIMSDGILKVASNNYTYYINPDQTIYVQRDNS